MTEKYKRPASVPGMSGDDRALAGLQRRKSAPIGVPILPADLAAPHEVTDPVTGVLEGEDLQRARDRRPTKERLAILEGKHDDEARLRKEDRERQHSLEMTVERLIGKMDTYVDEMKAERELEKARIHNRTKLVVGIVAPICAAIGAIAAAAIAGCM